MELASCCVPTKVDGTVKNTHNVNTKPKIITPAGPASCSPENIAIAELQQQISCQHFDMKYLIVSAHLRTFRKAQQPSETEFPSEIKLHRP